MDQVIRVLRRAALAGPAGGLDDGELLDRFLTHRDEAAFEALVRRHGPMVLGVCRRLLGHAQDAEDAFQATFLVLVRKGTTIRPRDRVGPWLYGVARKTAARARRQAARRQVREAAVPTLPDMPSPGPPAVSDEEVLLERELAALPEPYQLAILLCDLEGLSRAEAAARLGWCENTLSSRLARGRKLLAERLGRRDLPKVAPVLPAGLVQTTTTAASAVAAGTTSAVSAPVLTLMEGVLAAMVPLKLKFVAATVLAVGLIGFALGAGQGPGGPAQPGSAATPVPKVPADAVAPLGLALQLGKEGRTEGLLLHGFPSTQLEGVIQLEFDGQPKDKGEIQLRVVGQPRDKAPDKGTPFQLEVAGAQLGKQGRVPPELIKLLVQENDAEKRKLIGQLIEAYQRQTITLTLKVAGDKAAPPSGRDAALKKAEEAVRKLREANKDKGEAEAYDAILQALQKLKAPPK